MSQFQQNQPTEIDYQGRKVFQEPLKPDVYQEQMPYLPTPSFRVAYQGLNLAETGALLATAGSNIMEGYFKADAQEKNNALESIALESEKKLAGLYKVGAKQDELDQETNITKRKINDTLGYDPFSPEYDDGKEALIPQRHIINARKIVAGIDAQNDSYVTKNKASDISNHAMLVGIQLSDIFADNPNAPIELFNEGEQTLQRILDSLAGKKNSTSSDIQSIGSPQDKNTFLAVYKAKVDLKNDKNQEIARRIKAESGSSKDQTKREDDQLTDIMRNADGQLDVIKARTEALKNTGAGSTPEGQAELVSLMQQTNEVKDALNYSLSALDMYRYKTNFSGIVFDEGSKAPRLENERYPGERSSIFRPLKDHYIPRDMLDSLQPQRLISDSALRQPEVRTAYNKVVAQLQSTKDSFNTAAFDIQTKLKTAAIKTSTDRNKYFALDVDRSIAAEKLNGSFDKNRDKLIGQWENLGQFMLGTTLESLGEDKIRSIFDSIYKVGSILGSRPRAEENQTSAWAREKDNNFPLVREYLSFDTPPEQYSRIQSVLGDSKIGMEVWLDAAETFKKTQIDLFGPGESGRKAREEKEKQTLRTFRELGGQTVPSSTPAEYIGVIDTIISTASGDLDPTDLANLKPIANKIATQQGGIPLDYISGSSWFYTAVSKAESPRDLINLVASTQTKDKNGVLIPMAPSDWASSVSGASFPAFNLIKEKLNNADPESEEFGIALAAYAMLPITWRLEMLSGVKQPTKLNGVNEQIKLHPEQNIVELLQASSEGGYTDASVNIARATEESLVKAINSNVDILSTNDKSRDQNQVTFNKKITDAVNEGITSGLAKRSGLPVKETYEDYLKLESLAEREGYAILVGKTAKKFQLYSSRLSSTDALKKATAEAFKEYTDEYIYTPNGHIKRSGSDRDYEPSLSAMDLPSSLVNTRAYPEQPNNTAVLDQDLGVLNNFATSQGSKDTLAGFNIPPAKQTEASKNLFASIAMVQMTANGAITSASRTELNRIFDTKGSSESELAMVGELIEAGRTRDISGNRVVKTKEATRRELMILVAAIKEFSQSDESFGSKEDVKNFIKTRAIAIRSALAEAGDSFNPDTPYTFAFSSSSSVNGQAAYTLMLAKKKEDGSGYSSLTRLHDGLTSASVPGFARRGGNNNTQMLSGLGNNFLMHASDEELIPHLEKMYANGTLEGDFKYKTVKEDFKSKVNFSKRRDGVEEDSVYELKIRHNPANGEVTLERTIHHSRTALNAARSFPKRPNEPGYEEEQEAFRTYDKQYTEQSSYLPPVEEPVDLPEEPAQDMGLRQDGTPKGLGWLGPQKNSLEQVVTEYTVGVNINGKEMDIPTLVPGLSKDEIKQVLKASENGSTPPATIMKRAVDHALERIKVGESPFAPAIKKMDTVGMSTVPSILDIINKFKFDRQDSTTFT